MLAWLLFACAADDDPTSRVAAAPSAARTELRALLVAAGVEPLPPAPEVPGPLLELGILLNADPILSGNRNISCMTCHHPSLGSDDDLPTSIGQGGVGLGAERTAPYPYGYTGRNSPPIFNVDLLTTMFWDGHANVNADGSFTTSHDDKLTPELRARMPYGLPAIQALLPLTVLQEMLGFKDENDLAQYGDTTTPNWSAIWDGLTARVVATEAYRPYFAAAYPDVPFEQITIGEIGNAIGAMEIVAFDARDTPFDAFLAGDDDALSDEAVAGGLAFYDPDGANCVACHSGPLLTDFGYHDTALAQYAYGKPCGGSRLSQPYHFDDLGYACVTNREEDRYTFRTPPLRNLGWSGPYGHAGQYRTLEDYINHYVDPIGKLRAWDPAVYQDDRKLDDSLLPTQDAVAANASSILAEMRLSAEDIPSLAAFLHTLDDPTAGDRSEFVPDSVPSGLHVDRVGD